MSRNREELVHQLSDPRAYHPSPDSVRVVQTHGSCVFLTGRWAYKMKKEVKYKFFDFSTLSKRYQALEREFRLNRRLAPGVYKGVIPVKEKNGCIFVGAPYLKGKVVEHLLQMRELPEEGFLPRILSRGEGNPEIMGQIARKMAVFHHQAKRGSRIAFYGRPEKLEALFEGNISECAELSGSVRPPKRVLDDSRSCFELMLRKLSPVLQARVSEGFVRDLHGDFRMEHVVFLEGDVVIFDCIDFRDDFRYLDPAHENAAFLMEMRQAGYQKEAKDFLLAYLDESRDEAMLPVLPMYILHRALVRGKVEALKCSAPGLVLEERQEAAALSRRHFQTAVEIVDYEKRPRLVLICGLMASGKSALAKGLGSSAGMVVHRSDPLRKELVGIDLNVPIKEAWGRGLYSKEMTARVYEELFQRAEEDLKKGMDVIVDASFSLRKDRERYVRLAREMNLRFDIIECICPFDERRARLVERVHKGNSVSDGRIEIMEAQRAAFESIQERHIVVDTTGSKEESLAKGLRALFVV